MAASVNNLGRAYCKVVLYDKLPNLVVNTSKMRKEYYLALGQLEDQQVYGNTSFGIQSVKVEGVQGNDSGGILPAICYEPVDNFINSSTSSSVRSVTWKQMDWNAINISTRFAQTATSGAPATPTTPATTAIPIANMFFQLVTKEPDVPLASTQTWSNSEKTVYTYKYSEEEYLSSITPASSSATAASTTAASTASSGSGGVVAGTEVKSYIYQQNSGIGTWWGAVTDPFKLYSGGFWVSVFAKGAFISDDADMRKTSWICIKFNVDFNVPNGNSSPYFLLISNRGPVFVRYLFNNRVTDVPINMPHLVEAFKNGEEIRVGFFTMGSRLVVYTDQNRYDTVTFQQAVTLSNDKKDNAPYTKYVFLTKQVEVYGYACSAYVNVSEMTFFKKAWMVITQASGDENYIGYDCPESDGTLIAWNISNEQYLNNHSFPMWAAQFSYYSEVDFVGGSVRPVCRGNITGTNFFGDPETSSHISGNVNYGYWNSYPKWGKIQIGRSGPKAGIAARNFWYVFLGTEDIQDNILGITHERTGYPVLFNMFGKINMDHLANTGETMESFHSVEVTDDVMSVEISSQLDSPDKFSTIQKTASVTLFDDTGDYTKYLTRARGVKIWLKWSTEDTSDIDVNTDTPAFTGVAFGEKYSMKPGTDTITLTCSDYWSVLDRMVIKNSPFYDGFELVSVVNDLAERGGVFTEDDVDHVNAGYFYLGSGFSFDKPAYRFDKDDTLKNCMTKAIMMFPYYLWFDNQCVLHVSIVPADFDWGRTGTGWNDDVKKYYYRDITSIPSNHPEKLILNNIDLTSTLSSSIYNSFLIQGVMRFNNSVVMKSKSRTSSVLDPDSVGFLGFISEKEHRQACLDENTVSMLLDRFIKMYGTPGYLTSIQTVGHIPNYICGEFIKILQTPANDRGKFRVTGISQQYEADKNSWFTTITAYQIRQVLWNT